MREGSSVSRQPPGPIAHEGTKRKIEGGLKWFAFVAVKCRCVYCPAVMFRGCWKVSLESTILWFFVLYENLLCIKKVLNVNKKGLLQQFQVIRTIEVL